MSCCKKQIIAVFALLPCLAWSAAPVVDASDQFATMDQQQMDSASVAGSQYAENEDGPPLVKNDESEDRSNVLPQVNDSAHLLSTIQSLQKEVQALRGQLEVQAHDLKILQQQQIAFYKDLDSRLGKHDPGAGAAVPKAQKGHSKVSFQIKQEDKSLSATPSLSAHPVSRLNPAEEQISYMAAYELVRNKQYDEAIPAMQQFVAQYAQGGYVAHAQYWLGEMYLLRKNYPKAIAHFDVLTTQFPSFKKSAASTLKSGDAYAAMGEALEAKKRFQYVIQSYPNTSSAQLAQARLNAMKA